MWGRGVGSIPGQGTNLDLTKTYSVAWIKKLKRKKNQKEVLESKNTLKDIKNAFDNLMNRLEYGLEKE